MIKLWTAYAVASDRVLMWLVVVFDRFIVTSATEFLADCSVFLYVLLTIANNEIKLVTDHIYLA